LELIYHHSIKSRNTAKYHIPLKDMIKVLVWLSNLHQNKNFR
jgi:hypothetical protein